MGKDESNLKATKVPELKKALANFFSLADGKENGKDYEPDLLNVMQAALGRHLRSKNYPKYRVSVVEKSLRSKGKEATPAWNGKRPNKAQSLNKEDVETLWENGHLGNITPRSLITQSGRL